MSSDSGIKGARTLRTQGEQRKVFAVEESFVGSKEWKGRKVKGKFERVLKLKNCRSNKITIIYQF